MTVLGWLIRLTLAIAVALAFGEGALRLLDLGHPYYSAPEAYVPKDRPDWFFAPRPFFEGRSEGTWVKISSLGLRDGEYPPRPAPGTLRLLMLGDSVTFGPGVSLDHTFAKVLERRLAEHDASREFEVVNGGVVGYNTVQEHTLYREVGRGLHPNVVVLTFLVNDLLDTFSIFDHQYEPDGPFPDAKLWLRRESHLYRLSQNTYWQLVGDSRRVGAPQEAQRQRPRLEERQRELLALRAAVRADGADLFLALYPDNLADRVSPGPDGSAPTMREAMLEFAQRSGMPVLDLTDAIGDVRDPRARLMRLKEDPHPSVAGHRAIGDALERALRESPTMEAARLATARP